MYKIKSREFWWRWLPVVLAAAIIFILSAQISETKRLFIPSIEVGKELHVFIYFCLSLFLLRALKGKDGLGWKTYLAVFVLGLLYAISDEAHQTLVPGRGGEALDVLIDAVGISLAIFLVYLWSLGKPWLEQIKDEIFDFLYLFRRVGMD